MASQSGSYLKLGILVLIILLVVLVSSFFIKPSGSKTLISPEFFKAINLTSTFNFAFKSEELSNIIRENLEGKEGEYAIYIEDLSTDKAGLSDEEKYTLRSLDIFPSASLYKLYLMAAVIKELEAGNLKLETGISAKKSSLVEEFGGVDFGYEDFSDSEVIEYSIEEALTRVGRISDNFASLMLARKIGWEKIQIVADELGSKNTLIKSPITTSAEDIGDFFKALYQNKVISPFVSEKLIEFLSLNQLNNRIPAGLPEGVRVIHKTGELAGIRHDAGIVWLASQGETLEPKVYVIVLMSKNLKYEDEGVETLANISKEVYEYFEKKYELSGPEGN